MSELPRVSPKPGRFNAMQPKNQWYIACRADELTTKPLARQICGLPLVLFRPAGAKPTALIDRCAHRNVPLSAGRVVGDKIECAYHGWCFDGEGVCRHIPGLPAELGHAARGRRVAHFPTVEQQGYIWVFVHDELTHSTTSVPFMFPLLDNARYTSVRYEYTFNATLASTAENILDVPHTAFLHRGLFRGGSATNRIRVEVRRYGDRVEANYIGEPRPSGLLGRVLAPRGGEVTHADRFILPCIAQVEYALGDSHLLVTNCLTPVSDFETRAYTVVSLRLPWGLNLVRRLLTPIALRVAHQDAYILRLQSQTVERFGGEQFMSTDADILGSHILRLLKAASRGEIAPESEATVIDLEV